MSSQRDKAERIYAAFHEEKSDGGMMVNIPVPPKMVWQLGEVLSIAYKATIDGKMVSYEHDFKRGCGPFLAVSVDGKDLFLAGGSFKVTERGIVDI